MAKDILLYGSIDSYSSREFVQAVIDSESEDVFVRVCSPGGDVQYGWACVSKFANLTGNKTISNDGKAHSMAAFLFCYADDAEAIDTAEFIFHRAAYASWVEADPDLFDEEAQADLQRTNTSLRKAFEAKIDVPLFEELKGVTIKQLFSLDARVEVTLTAAEAKKIGLINRVVTITPKKKSEISALMREINAKSLGFSIAAHTHNSNPTTMTIEELQQKHPAVYAAVFALGKTEGISAEKDRVGSYMAYAEIDIKEVKAGIASGASMTETQRSEFSVKVVSAKMLNNLTEDGKTKDITTTATTEEGKKAATEKEKEVLAFAEALDKKLGLGKK